MTGFLRSKPAPVAPGSGEPAYLALYRSGELHNRVEKAYAHLAECRLCPRNCGVDRTADRTAACKTGRDAVVSSYGPHLGEEDCLRGWSGSGTIFFTWCNLRCVFCQNYEISQRGEGRPTSTPALAAMMLDLQAQDCHNINLVTPEHVVPQVMAAIALATERGLRLPIVYNTSAYDSLDSLRLLDGIIDIYMPDFKFWDPRLSLRYLKAKDYPETARQAIREMHRQVGTLQLDERGLARRGVLVRHLIMPGHLDETKRILYFLADEVSADTYVNLMTQYRPANKVNASEYAEIDRGITADEYRAAVDYARGIGLWRLDERRRAMW